MSRILIDNRYSLGDLLGIGGTAEVYLAHDEILDRDVALKVLRSQHAENEEFVKLFRREARSAAALNHPNVVPVYYWGRSEDGRYYMTMEDGSGGTPQHRRPGLLLGTLGGWKVLHDHGVRLRWYPQGPRRRVSQSEHRHQARFAGGRRFGVRPRARSGPPRRKTSQHPFDRGG